MAVNGLPSYSLSSESAVIVKPTLLIVNLPGITLTVAELTGLPSLSLTTKLCLFSKSTVDSPAFVLDVVILDPSIVHPVVSICLLVSANVNSIL